MYLPDFRKHIYISSCSTHTHIHTHTHTHTHRVMGYDIYYAIKNATLMVE